jgi:hypothetical protein
MSLETHHKLVDHLERIALDKFADVTALWRDDDRV